MNNIMKQVQKMQDDMQALREELDAREYEASTGGGVVSVKVNGKKQITELTIKPEAADPEDTEMLADLIVAAVNMAQNNAEQEAAAEMEKASSAFNVPGLPQIPGLF